MRYNLKFFKGLLVALVLCNTVVAQDKVEDSTSSKWSNNLFIAPSYCFNEIYPEYGIVENIASPSFRIPIGYLLSFDVKKNIVFQIGFYPSREGFKTKPYKIIDISSLASTDTLLVTSSFEDNRINFPLLVKFNLHRHKKIVYSSALGLCLSIGYAPVERHSYLTYQTQIYNKFGGFRGDSDSLDGVIHPNFSTYLAAMINLGASYQVNNELVFSINPYLKYSMRPVNKYYIYIVGVMTALSF